MFPRPGCSKRPSNEAAANYHLIRGGWDDPNCARPTREVCDRALREHGDRPSHPAPFFSILLGLFDRFFVERPAGLCIEGHLGLTNCEFTRNGKFFDRQEGLLGVAEFFEFTQRGELAQVL